MTAIPSLLLWPFALAGLLCALGPLVIHLLNRRRFKVVYWAAMDFLREALQRNRRVMELRDLALLALRTFAVLLFGLALAQPFIASDARWMWSLVFPAVCAGFLCAIVAVALWSHAWARWLGLLAACAAFALAGGALYTHATRGGGQRNAADSSQPLHAVLVVDNSLSMGYQQITGTVLDDARQRAKEYIEKLPRGSRVSVLPLCGSAQGHALEPYRSKDDALEALQKIEVVDRSASARQAAALAQKACEALPELAKRVVFFSDQQEGNWRDLRSASELAKLPSMQVVDVSPTEWENAWIADLRLQDGLADTETPAVFVAEIRYQGPQPQRDTEVTLEVDGVEVASKNVRVEAGAAREVTFEHLFTSARPEPGKPVMVPTRVRLASDRLAADNQRVLTVPVVAALPVVFVDQYRQGEEDVAQNKLGETRSLRKLLAPVASRGQVNKQLVQVKHVRLEDLTEELLQDARLVVIAGVADPGGSVPLLRDYARQGGQLVIAAGGQFDFRRWNERAWLDGAGLLPLPLAGELGSLPDEVQRLEPFHLAAADMPAHGYFQLANVAEEELTDLYAQPLFFKLVDTSFEAGPLDQPVAAEAARRLATLRFLAEAAAREREVAALAARNETPTAAQRDARAADEEKLRALAPAWLLWSDEQLANEQGVDRERVEQTLLLALGFDQVDLSDPKLLADWDKTEAAWLANAQWQQRVRQDVSPRVLARFDTPKQTPFLIERKLGRGQVLFVATGVGAASNWNTLPKMPAMLMFDRALRGMIRATLPRRNFEPAERLTLPAPAAGRDVVVELRRPDSEKRGEPAKRGEPLDLGFIGERQRGVQIPHVLQRGLYRVTARQSVAGGEVFTSATGPTVDTPGADNSPADDSAGDASAANRSSAESAAALGPVLWDLPLAVNGPAEESELQSLSRQQFQTQLGDATNLQWIGPGEEINISGAAVRGANLWWWLILAVLAFLLFEMLILAASEWLPKLRSAAPAA